MHTRVSQGSHTHSHTHTYTHTHTCTHKHSHVWPVCCVIRDMWCVAWYVTCGVICGFVDWNVEQGFQKKRGESKLAFDVEETFVKNM